FSIFALDDLSLVHSPRSKILKLIKDENPDILCLEEYYWDTQDNAEPYTGILQQSGYPFVAFATEYEMAKGNITSHALPGEKINVGQAIFSKYPLKNTIDYDLYADHYKMLKTDVVIDSNNVFSLNVVHLTSVGFGRKEMGYISDIKKTGVDAENNSRSKSLLKKLVNAAANRSLLANKIDSLRREMDYPQVICGDFNDMPGSYVYAKVKGPLKDAFVKKGTGLGRTYRLISPTLRIDYILYDDNALKIEGYRKPDVDLSDHYPVMANFSIKTTKK
ncbi:MAG: endonuclease/exonuclease/phosphatase family protein, partial [Edaphocola sp.]